MDNEQKTKGYGSALDKALAVLELITEQRQAVGLPDLAAKMDMPRQSVHRILLQLEELGLIIRDAS
ncbi:MAG: helix-turn-helix domain-containing protein, partial [Rhodospirillales bacterium]